MKSIGVVAGSFDPITHGHAWLIEKSALLVDELHIVIGVNPAKKYWFNENERLHMVRAVVESLDQESRVPVFKSRPNFPAGSLSLHGTKTEIHFLSKDLLIHFAGTVNATHLIRGIRNAVDFNYETQMAAVNRRIDPTIETFYLSPPSELSEVSSSTVRGLVGFTNWQSIVSSYVHPVVLSALNAKSKTHEGTNK